jgi:hypothetical protein
MTHIRNTAKSLFRIGVAAAAAAARNPAPLLELDACRERHDE